MLYKRSDNKYSMGKYLRNQKGLRKADPKVKSIEQSQQTKEYIEYLQENGLEFNKLEISQFETKNGLPYSGFVAKEQIITNEDLIIVPKKLLLTTRSAYLSDIKTVFQENPEFYSSHYHSSWEDHILLTFILYEYQKGRESQWYHLIINLPKDLDYVIFWEEKELHQLEDKTLVREAKSRYKEFREEYDQLYKIMKKYPKFFTPTAYQYDNVKWVYTHLVTRCFGKYLNWVTMVPLVEMFNHECSDVYYDLDYEEDNKFTPKNYERTEPAFVKQDELDQESSSQGTYDSEDEENESEFDYEDVKSPNVVVEIDKDSDLQMKENQQKIHDVFKYLNCFLDNGDDFTIFYCGQVYKSLESIEKMIAQGHNYFDVKEKIERIQLQNMNYRKLIIEHQNRKRYENGKRGLNALIPQQCRNLKKKFFEDQEEVENYEKVEKPFLPDDEWKEDPFDWFTMKTSRKDQFEKNSQVYFCYGRISNRMMLLRYGMALEYNKYDHIHQKISYFDYLKDSDRYSEKTQKFVQNWGLSKYKRFKLKYTKFNLDIYFFFKAQIWKSQENNLKSLFFAENFYLERDSFQMLLEYYQKELLNNFSNSLEENEKQLLDKNIGYHEYFALVFKIERQRIYKQQIELVKVCIAIINRLLQHKITNAKIFRSSTIIEYYLEGTLQNASFIVEGLETDEEHYKRNRVLLRKYFELIQYKIE